MIKRIVLVIVLAMAAVSLFGCNTVSGFGRDISGASQTVEGWFTSP